MNLDTLLDIQQVENALQYALDGDRILRSKLKEYQKNRSEDSRYPFKVVNLLEEKNIVVCLYRSKWYIGQRYTDKADKIYSFKVTIVNSENKSF